MATRRWRPTAAKIKQVDEITFALTWAQGDTAQVFVGAASLTVTVGASDTATTAVAQAVADAINSTAAGGETVGTDSTVGVGGQTIPEFKEVSATVSGSVVMVTADDAGEDFVLSVTETTAGDGTATEATVTTATGPNDFGNAANWDTGVAPADNDTIIYDNGNRDCTLGLDTGIQPESVIVESGFTGKIGRPPVNQKTTGGRTVASDQYAEYRAQSLTFVDNAQSTGDTVIVGRGTGSGSAMVNIYLSERDVNLTVLSTGTPQPPSGTNNVGFTQHALNVSSGGANVADANIQQGSVFIGHEPDAAGVTVSGLRVGRLGDADNLTSVRVAGGHFVDADATVYSGVLNIENISGTTASLFVHGGLLNLRLGTTSITTVDVFGGMFNADATSVNITNLTVGADGTFTHRFGGKGTSTVTNTTVAAGATLNDPGRRVAWTNGIDFVNCSPHQVTLNIGTDLTLTPSDL